MLVLLDQLRADSVGAYGSRICRTPRMDELAAQGVTFERAYTPIGICSPARASLVTGKYPHRHGVINNVHMADAIQRDLRPGETCFPALLRDAGYRTAYSGKWHVSNTTGPDSKGFTDVLGTDSSLAAELEMRRRELGLDPGGPVFTIDRKTDYPPLSRLADRPPLDFFPVYGRETYPLEATPQGHYLDSSIRLLEEVSASGQPFCAVLSFIGPHWPHVLPEPWWSMYEPAAIPVWPNFEDDFQDKPGANRRFAQHYGTEGWTWRDWAPVVASYYGSVTMHDELVGRFVDALDRLGHRDDTLVIVTADHGDLTGSHRLFNKGPVMYEEVYRVPFIARWPGAVPAGTRRREYVSILDLYRTFCEAAGVDVPKGAAPDSESLLPLLRNEAAPGWRSEFFAEFHGDEFGLYSQRMLHADRYKLVFNPHDLDELYDLHADPHELVNLSGDPAHAELKDELEARLHVWMRRTEDPLGQLSLNYLA